MQMKKIKNDFIIKTIIASILLLLFTASFIALYCYTGNGEPETGYIVMRDR